MSRLFPTVMIVLSLCASAAYVPTGNWRMVVYWAAAATLTAVVTW